MVVTELTDAELLDRARDGDESAFTSLYVRHHGAIARLAASYRRHEPEDLVDATFGQVVSQLRRRSGPTEAFRAYLFAMLHAEVVAAPPLARAPVEPVPGPVALVAGLPALGGADREMITRAFESLPDQWQVPLWHTTIVGTDLPTLAAGLSVTVSAARPLARYAGRKLRQAYLQAHLDAAPRPACEPHRERLTAHLQGALDDDADAGVRAHLERCDSCRELVAGLSGVEELLARSVVPFFPVAAGRGGVPTPLGAPGSAAIEVTGEGPVLDVSDVPPEDGAEADDASAGFVGWWRRRRKPPSADEADLFAPVLGAPVARREPDLPQEDVGGGPAGADGEDDTGGFGDRDRGRRVMPALGGAAAVTVLVAALAVVGARVMGDDSAPGLDGASAGEADGLGSTDGAGAVVDSPSGSSGSGSRDGRKGTSDRTTTTAAGDDRRPSDDDDRERIEPVPRRGDSVVASDSDAGSTTVTTAGRRSTTTTTRPATTTTTTAPDPPSLASWSVAWSSGTLRVTVQSPSGTADTHSVVVTVNLSSGAHVASLDGGCSGSGPVTCTIAAPEAGSATAVSIGLTVDGPGETATVSARQGSNSLGSQSVSLAVEAAA